MRRIIVYIILGSMTLHCAGKLGLLDELYQKRLDIAFSLGLIREIPIAMCSSDYDFNGGLKIVSHDNSHAVPLSLTQTREINLFYTSVYYHTRPTSVIISRPTSIHPVDLYGLMLVTTIFHPPSV